MALGDPLVTGALVAGKYRVEERIDDGSMSIVARACVEGGDKRVALKVVHPELAIDAELIERFRREARALGRMQSPHAVRMYELCEVATQFGSLPCMVMEWLEGEDLDHKLDAEGPFELQPAVRAIVEACDAVSEAHALGIVHRDLKPANLFLTNGVVKVIDFGIAKDQSASEASLTGTGAAMGSPLYMSPEQIRCERVDARADIWALGVTLFELLVGVTPFEGDAPAMVLAGILGRSAPSILEDRPDVPVALDAIVLRCLEKERLRRFASAAALAEALERFT